MSIKPQSIMLLAGWLLAAPAMALTPSNSGSGSNSYMFIDLNGEWRFHDPW